MQVDFESLYEQKNLNFLNEEEVNYIIKNNKLDTNKISDGYHTFEQLYEHRIVLYIALCKMMANDYASRYVVWASTKHSDGSEWDGWFLLGISKFKDNQITYHLPAKYWGEVCDFAEILETAPEFDGHTSEDVLQRLSKL